MRRIEPFAYGALGLRPWELPRYTPREFGALVEGWQRVQHRQRRQIAELACWLLSPYVEKHKRLTPDDLLGRPRPEDL